MFTNSVTDYKAYYRERKRVFRFLHSCTCNAYAGLGSRIISFTPMTVQYRNCFYEAHQLFASALIEHPPSGENGQINYFV